MVAMARQQHQQAPGMSAPTSGVMINPEACPCKLFVGGLSAHATTESLRAHFSKYGRVVDAVVMSKNSRPRGFGFVTYDKPSAAAKALVEPQYLDGRLVDVKRAVPGEKVQERASNKLFVGGLPQDVTTEELRQYFSSYGDVADAVVMVDRRTNRSRGFGFIRFHNGPSGSAAADTALGDFHVHHLGGKWIEVKPAAPAAVLHEVPSSGSEDNIGDGEGCDWLALAMAYSDPSEGSYLMEMSAWDGYCVGGYAGDMAHGGMMDGMMGAMFPRTRGRRGRRRKLRSPSGLSGCGGEWFAGDGGAQCMMPELDGGMADDGSAAEAIGNLLAGCATMSFLHEVCAHGDDAFADCLRDLGGFPVATEKVGRKAAAGADNGAPSAAAGEITAENNAARATAVTATPKRPCAPADFLASPMKVGLLGLSSPLGREGSGAQPGQCHDVREGFTREEFLSLEVRPWTVACW
mmetsp:Transcript_79076/g.228644  ORF Transcript_79076/g.228644 Transcript_79076/m.228644 type:complete len:463 (+) Transcript_79076:124-1512(+)